MTLEQLTVELRTYNNLVAYGSECSAWQDYHADCHETFGVGPTDDIAGSIVVTEEFADYWLKVTEGV